MNKSIELALKLVDRCHARAHISNRSNEKQLIMQAGIREGRSHGKGDVYVA